MADDFGLKQFHKDVMNDAINELTGWVSKEQHDALAARLAEVTKIDAAALSSALDRVHELEARLADALAEVERYKAARTCDHCVRAAAILRGTADSASDRLPTCPDCGNPILLRHHCPTPTVTGATNE